MTALSPATTSPTTAAVAPFGLDPQRLTRAKTAYTTRHLAARIAADPTGYHLEAGPDVTPRAHDVVLARVVEVGQHKRLEGPDSRRQLLFPGDEILVAYGHRYAPDQFESQVPPGLGRTHLVAAGGLAGDVTAAHDRVVEATVIEPVGLLADEDGVVSLRDLAPHRVRAWRGSRAERARRGLAHQKVVAVFGTSMNSGKSTTVAHLVHGLRAAGLEVAAGKATGTGAGGDRHMFHDAGASTVLDFTDYGYGSTYRLGYEELKDLVASVVHDLSATGAHAVVLEIADGVYQGETARLLADPDFRDAVDGLVFAAGDALGAEAGTRLLRETGHHVAAVSGVVTASPLATREAAATLAEPVVPTLDLSRPQVAYGLYEDL